MQKKKVNSILRLALGFLTSVFLFVNSAGTVKADVYTEMMQQFTGVTVSNTGEGWTTDYKLQIAERHDYGHTVTTGAISTKEGLGPGEHYYSKDATGLIPVSKWTLRHKTAQCIHTHTYPNDNYGGFVIGNQVCLTNYSSGWFATCANCKEEIEYLVYARESTVSEIAFIPADSMYVYVCPWCNNMEQGIRYSHRCFSYISKNYYRVQYRPNYPEDVAKTNGWLPDTYHMVDNATEYDGVPTRYKDTCIRMNGFVAEGYVFAGWNTKPDGTGVAFMEGQNINFCPEEDGTAYTLYAQWERRTSTLVIDENGGTYAGYTGPITQDYGSTWEFDVSKITPPDGPTVTFDHNGGRGVASIQSTKSYKDYTISTPTSGLFVGNIYTFLGDNTTDIITLNYRQNSILLPTSTRSGYSFAGWYFDEACTKPVGSTGEEYMPPGDVTLYALWADLVLTGVDDYDSNDGKGAVDLSWMQADGEDKVYQVYQYSELDDTPVQVGASFGGGSGELIKKTFNFTGDAAKTYTIPASGYYTLTLNGAQGGNYNNTFTGGPGGRTTARVYLEQGEILTYNIGGQNGYNGGGAATDFGNGGGYSIVSSNLKGELLIAGGGGGATDMADGKPGGEENGLTTGRDGQDGMAGGGGGARGGSSEAKSEAPHIHSGNKYQGGGCYTVPIYGHREHTDVKKSAVSCYTTPVNEPCSGKHHCVHQVDEVWWDCIYNSSHGNSVKGKKCYYQWFDCAGEWHPCGGFNQYDYACTICGGIGQPSTTCGQVCNGQGHTCSGISGYTCSLQNAPVVTEWALGCGYEAHEPDVLELSEYAAFTYSCGSGWSHSVVSGFSTVENAGYYGAMYRRSAAGNLVIRSAAIETPDSGNLFFDISNIIHEGENAYFTGAYLSGVRSYMVSVLDANTGETIVSRDVIGSSISHTTTSSGTEEVWEYTETAQDIYIGGTRRRNTASGQDIVDASIMVPITDSVDKVQIVITLAGNAGDHLSSYISGIQYQWNGNSEMTEQPKEAVAYGGSNYVNELCCITYESESGKAKGNGFFILEAESIGFVTDMVLADIPATDMAAPDIVDEDRVVKRSRGKTRYEITFDKPADHGTSYYHYVKSFEAETGEESLTSNTTVNTLTSGVERYYYFYNTSPSAVVTASASYVTGESITVTVPAAGTTKYLHIATADKAGNLSATVHVELKEPKLEQDVVYKPRPNTEQIGVTPGDGVATGVDERSFFVRSDGQAVIELSDRAYLTDDGSREAVQVDTVRFNVCNTAFAIREWAESGIPYATDGNLHDFGNDELRTDASVQEKMLLYGVSARRYGRDGVTVFHRYTIPGTYSGQTFVVYPGAYTTYRHIRYASDDGADRENYITLICDGTAPVISGLDAITGLDVLNMQEEERRFTVTAEDDLSGLQDFTITLQNRDCAITRTYRDEDDGVKDGSITIVVPRVTEGSAEGIEFCGDFTLTGSAVDRVGNVRSTESSSLAVLLSAELKRVLFPHEPIFKQGESGVLNILTQGYVERVEVVFPEELESDTTYSYIGDLQQYKEEQLEFMIPLDFPEGEYRVYVTGYKTGTDLEHRPEILTFVVRGSVLDELRTRLR